MNKPSAELLKNPAFYREVAMRNLAFFSKYYLELLTPKHFKKWCRITETAKRDLILAPRDHGKSTLYTYAYPIFEICKNRDIRILIISKTGRQAQKFLTLVLKELENNKKLIKDFGRFKGDGSWTSSYIYVNRNKNMKEPTIESIGVLGAITGGHYDIIIADDIIDDENTRTIERMDTVKNWFYGTVMQLAEPWTKVICVGTRKHYLDLYNELLKNPIWRHNVDKAIIKYPDKYDYLTNEEGQITDVEVKGEHKVLWPQKWDIKTLLIDRKTIGPILFDREKQNDPSGMRGQILKREWLHFYTSDVKNLDLPHPPFDFKNIYIGVDLAISDNPDADYFVAVTVGECHKGFWWVLDIYRDRLEFPDQVILLKQLNMARNPTKVFIEKNAYQLAISQHLIRETNIPVVPIRTKRDKVSRMIAITPHFQNGKVKIKDDMDLLITEWVQFPKSEHDDILDALDFALTALKEGQTALTYGKFSNQEYRRKMLDKESNQFNVKEFVRKFAKKRIKW